MKTQHPHVFVHTGGGFLDADDDDGDRCDDQYECECGAEIEVYCRAWELHISAPEVIEWGNDK